MGESKRLGAAAGLLLLVLAAVATATATASTSTSPLTSNWPTHTGQGRVVQLLVLHRHGDRTPLTELPKDPVHWQLGRGQLTGVGMRQLYDLGVLLRKMYGEAVFGTHFCPIANLLRSSQYDRTIMSAQSLANGIWGPGTGPLSEVDGVDALPHRMQTFPVHNTPKVFDPLLMSKDICPELVRRKAQFHQSHEYQQAKSKYAPLVQRIKEVTGFNATLENFYHCYDAINVQMVHKKLHIPELLNDPELLRQAVELGEWSEYNNHRWDVVGKLGGGLMARDLLRHMRAKVATPTEAKRFVHWSAHDATLLVLTSALQLDREHRKLATLPPYASAMAFELWQMDEDAAHGTPEHYRVAIRFKRGDEPNFDIYNLPGLPLMPTLDQFANFLEENSVVNDWCAECHAQDTAICKSGEPI